MIYTKKMKSIEMTVAFEVDVPEDETELGELFINIPDMSKLKVQKYNPQGEIQTLEAEVVGYESINAIDFAS